MSTHTLASWTSSTASIPTPVALAAQRSLYNYVGCAIGGSTHEVVSTTTKALSPALVESANLIQSSPSLTALTLGIASHIHDYDDTHLATIIHPTGPIASALLAYLTSRPSSQPAISGSDFLTPLALGIETSCILGLSVWPAHYDIGWHITPTTGAIGAAVAVGKLMGLDTAAMENAIGLASAQVVGQRIHFGSHAKAFGVGRAAEIGLTSALLAKEGLASASAALEGKRGWIECVCPTPDLAKSKLSDLLSTVVRNPNHAWEVQKNTFKPFPCGIVVHPVIDACIQLHKSWLNNLPTIPSVMLKVHPLVLELTGKKEPHVGLEGKFSVYHGAAVGLLYGKATPAEYEDEVVQRPEVVELRRKIEAAVDKELGAEQCIVEVNLGGEEGKQVKKYVKHAVGSLEVPMSEMQLREKFLDQCSKAVGEEKAGLADKACKDIGGLKDVRVLLDILCV